MRLPKDILTGTMTKPRLFLCETDKTKICELDTIEMSGTFKFNAYSELTCSIPRTYTNITTGATQINPFYDKIEALRLVYLDGFGYFEIQDPELTSDGIREAKSITANSLEYTLSQKYLENLKINTGEIDSLEVLYAQENDCAVVPIAFYNPIVPGLSLLDLVLEKIYGWKIGHVDESLWTMTRKFEISRTSVYDFIAQDLCDKFNCFAVFDTINNTISFYAESLISKFIGDGNTIQFTISPAYSSIGTVSIDGYKTIAYQYEIHEDNDKNKTGILTFNEAPEDGAKIEITDGSQEKWTTDVYVSFDNLAQEVKVSYSADDIKTVLTVKGADDLDIREVNMGLPYIVDLSYYYNVDWMGQELYDAYTAYVKKTNENQETYTNNSQEILKLQNDINFVANRTTLGYGMDSSVGPETVGTYYVIDGGSYPNYFYREVSLPTEYNANVTYYKLNGVNVTEDKVLTLYSAVRKFFVRAYHQSEPGITDIATRDEDLEDLLTELTDEFKFVADEFNELKQLLMVAVDPDNLPENIDEIAHTVSETFKDFLILIFNEIGLTPLNDLFLKPYEKIKAINEEAGYSALDSEYYWFYYPVTIMLTVINDTIKQRQDEIDKLNAELKILEDANAAITESISIYNNFTPAQLVRLSSFLREDEYTDDNFVVTDIDTIETSIQIKQELLECGRIELAKLCEPKLEFSMDMANIYALPEFEPIIGQFQLGKLINVVIRPDYVKRARLLSVNLNFDDFSDFSCEFGELTNLKTPSSIHADLLASALSAGKTVASNLSYWNKGADMATETDLKIQQGLLSAIGGIYTSDQSTLIDDRGILLRKVNEDGTFSPKQAWFRNNALLLSEDGFSPTSTSSLGLGEFTVNGRTFYGILAKAIVSGCIESSDIVGGTINIGEGKFTVDNKGNVTIKAGTINGYAENDNLISSINACPEEVAIDSKKISLAGKHIDLTSENITIDSEKFSVTQDGKITAQKGNIGGWNVDSSFIDSTVTDSNERFYLASASDGASNWICASNENSSLTFYVTKTGHLYAKEAEIEGKITSSSGQIGGWTIGTTQISNSITDNGNTYLAIMNCPQIFGSDAPHNHVAFGVQKNGEYITQIDYTGGLHSTNATISGNITAMSLDVSSATITGKIGANNLDSKVITTDNFSTNTLSTGKISVTDGGKIGSWRVMGDNLASGSGLEQITLHSGGISHDSGGTVSWWSIVSAANSDVRLKNSIESIDDKYNTFFDSLNPVSFKFNAECDEGRVHLGFIAQDVLSARDNAGIGEKDLSALQLQPFTQEDPTEYYKLDKQEFIALNTWQIQKLKTRVEALETKLATLEV